MQRVMLFVCPSTTSTGGQEVGVAEVGVVTLSGSSKAESLRGVSWRLTCVGEVAPCDPDEVLWLLVGAGTEAEEGGEEGEGPGLGGVWFWCDFLTLLFCR